MFIFKITRSLSMVSALFIALSLNVYAEESTTYTFDDWRVTCAVVKNSSKTQCLMHQAGLNTQTGQTVFQLGVRPLTRNEILLELMLPLGIKLKEGVKVIVDEKQRLNLDYDFCNKMGCFASFKLNKKLLSNFKKGKESQLLIQSMDSKKIKLPFSLKGFTKAINQLKTKNKK